MQELNNNHYQEHYYRLSAKARIWQDNKMVLVRENGKAWDLPGGGIKHSETIEDGLRRELIEEIGFGEVAINDAPKIFKMIDPVAGRPLLFLAYEFVIPEDAILTIGENTEIGLFDRDKIPENLVELSEEYARYIKFGK